MYEYYRRVHEQGHRCPLTDVAGNMWYGLMNPIKKRNSSLRLVIIGVICLLFSETFFTFFLFAFFHLFHFFKLFGIQDLFPFFNTGIFQCPDLLFLLFTV